MRVLCTATGAPSHGRALLPLIRALAGDGHEVTVVTTETIAPLITGADGIRLRTSMPLLPPPRASGSASAPGDAAARFRTRVAQLTGPYALEILGVLRGVARDVRPDVVLRHGMDLGSCLLAEELGVPHLPVPCGFVNMADPAALLPALNGLRAEAGLPARDDPGSLYPYGRLDYVPPEYSFAEFPVPVLAYRQSTSVDATALPSWVTRLPPGRPLVFASVGTSLPAIRGRSPDGRMPEGLTDPAAQLRTIVAALSRLDVNAIVATAGIDLGDDLRRGSGRGRIGPGSNIRLVDRIAQPLLLECADLLVTHGGYNSVGEALRTATPMAVVPNFADQPHNARRVQELGLGRFLTDPTPHALAAMCQDLLDDAATAARLRAARLAVLALPDVTRVAADLADIVAAAGMTRNAEPCARPAR
ncbi:glycosyltransferase [Streptomyces paludis]|uniref:Glycosyltransferase n=1 Tax=Streptomyces paludis TaxID=2282738 RepID=A0A345HQ38_9ACTN|nr:glycosyltransferase [Streptomyces paludis]AXG78812.1 glycosyltransferase [Streptomyces paludis]